jgi:RNA recognition motif-containing protein
VRCCFCQENGGEGPSGRPSAAEQQFYRDNCTAFVKNLPFKAEKEELEKFFEDCGGAKEARILRGPDGRTKVRAFLAKPRLAFTSPVSLKLLLCMASLTTSPTHGAGVGLCGLP